MKNKGFTITLLIVALGCTLLLFHRLVIYRCFDGTVLLLEEFNLSTSVSVYSPLFTYHETDLKKFGCQTEVAISILDALLQQGNSERKRVILIVNKNLSIPACSELNGSKVEMNKSKFDQIIKDLNESNEYNTLIFYELGRLYWSFEKQFFTNETRRLYQVIHTGYAVFIRMLLVTKMSNFSFSGVNGNDMQSYFHLTEKTLSDFTSNSHFDFYNTLWIDKAIPNNHGMTSENLFASMIYYLYRNCGGDEFLSTFMAELKHRTNARCLADVADNLFISACISSKTNLINLFECEWKWPLSECGKAQVLAYGF